jgi:hypothetical protein
LNASIVRVVSHPAAHQPTSTARIEAALNALVADSKRSQSNGSGSSSH